MALCMEDNRTVKLLLSVCPFSLLKGTWVLLNSIGTIAVVGHSVVRKHQTGFMHSFT